MSRCDCGAYITSGSECQTCRLEHQHGTLEDRRENCTVCGATIGRDAPTTTVDGGPAHAECQGQLRCDGGTQVSRAASKAVGELVEEIVIQSINDLEPAPVPDEWDSADEDYWHDAQPEVALFGGEQIAMMGICSVEPGQPVEIKAARAEISNGTQSRCGRFYITRRQHERLLDENGVYLFVVYDGVDEPELIDLIATAAVIVEEELRPTWYEVDGRLDYYQISVDRLPVETNGGAA